MERNDFLKGARASLPTAVGYVSIGIACGVVGASSGLSAWQMFLMSVFIYGGSSQFAFAALVLANASLLSIVITVFLVNSRHFLMSLHTTTIFKKISLLRGIGIGTLLTDESYGVLLGEHIHNKNISFSWMNGNNLVAYLTWVVAVTVGTLIGSYIPNPHSLGLDFALIAMFVSIFESQICGIILWLKTKKIFIILLSVTISYLLLCILLSESMAVLGATLFGCTIGVIINDK